MKTISKNINKMQKNKAKINNKESLNDLDQENKDNLLAKDAEQDDISEFESLDSQDLLSEVSEISEIDDEELELIDIDMDVDSKNDILQLEDQSKFSHYPIASPTRNLPSLTGRDSLQVYLNEISRFPMLAADEELELANRVKLNGDSDAAFRLISSHLRLVVRIAMDFQRRWMQNVLDLIQEGNVGLMRAVNKFDPDKGIKFSYYATFWIKAYILKFIMDNWRMVKIGTTQAQRKLFYNLNKERQKLIAEGFDPDSTMLAEKLGVSVEQIEEMQSRLGSSDMSLDLPINDEQGASSRLDFLPALGPGIEDSYSSNEIAGIVQDSLKDILPSLSEKEVYILEHRLLTDDPSTLREIGEKYNVTRERIRQLEARLLVKLKNHLSADIKDFSEHWIDHD